MTDKTKEKVTEKEKEPEKDKGTEKGDGKKKEVVMDRMVKDVVAPPHFPLTKEELFDDKDNPKKPNLKVLKEHLLREGRLDWAAAEILIEEATKLIKAEPNILELKYPITVCGDIHGQFFDLVRLFEVGGDPKETQYLFLGDYVDRGCFSTEVVFYLYALKIIYPTSFFMLRGNHECRQLTAFFNFKDECSYKYEIKLYDTMMAAFDNLPLAAIINKAFFCVHGGLSPDINTLDDIKKLDRFQEIPREGPMCDLLWSDPYEEETSGSLEGDRPQTPTNWFGYNDTRQCSYIYGIEAVKKFLKDNKLTSVIRAHEAQADGYKMQMVNRASGIPRVITIFSAPNYCDAYGNKAACLKFDNNVLNIKQFIESPHPYYLPNFMDVFQWSLPFVAEKVTDMLASVLDYSGEDGDGEEEDPMKSVDILERKGGMFKKKVTAVTKLLRMYKVLREENEAIVALKQLLPTHKVPVGLLSEGSEAIKKALTDFEGARKADKVNEKRPTSQSDRYVELAKSVSTPTTPRTPSFASPTSPSTIPAFVVDDEDEDYTTQVTIKRESIGSSKSTTLTGTTSTTSSTASGTTSGSSSSTTSSVSSSSSSEKDKDKDKKAKEKEK